MSDLNDIERLMQGFSALDSAAGELCVGEGVDPEDLMPEMEDIPEDVVLIPSNVKEEVDSDVTEDYKKVRSHLDWALRLNQVMLVNNARLSVTTMHPKNFEAHHKLIESHIKIASNLVELTGKMNEGKMKARITNQVVPEGDDNVGDKKQEHTVLERRATSSSLFEVITHSRESGRDLTNEEINRLALKLDEEKQSRQLDGDIEEV